MNDRSRCLTSSRPCSQWNYNAMFSERDAYLEEGVFDSLAETVFTRGHCHSLAVALQDFVDGSLIGAYKSTAESAPWHVALRLADGRIVDSAGVWDDDFKFLGYTQSVEIRDVDYDEIDHWIEEEWYRDWRVDDARSFAEALVKREGLTETSDREAVAA